MTTGTAIHDCTSAEEFLAALSPQSTILERRFSGSDNRWEDYIFRGHCDDSYLLLPSALRVDNSFRDFGYDSCHDNRRQIKAEIDSLTTFFELADTRGLSLPEDSQSLRSSLRLIRTPAYWVELDRGTEKWPPQNLLSLCALAQHYKLPTRFLDWSHRPLIAAYFAAGEALEKLRNAQIELLEEQSVQPSSRGGSSRGFFEPLSKKHGSNFDSPELSPAGRKLLYLEHKKLTVWAFAANKLVPRKRFIDDDKFLARYGELAKYPFAQVTAPHANNAHLHAQDGLFTVLFEDLSGQLDKPVDRSTFDDVVERFAPSKETTLTGMPRMFHQIRLSWLHAARLVMLLHESYIDKSTVFPGYESVVLSMKESFRSNNEPPKGYGTNRISKG